MRIYASQKTVEDLKSSWQNVSHDGLKPIGIWYGWKSEWLNWCISKKFCNIEYEHFYHVDVKGLNVLKITNASEFKKFEQQFMFPLLPTTPLITKGIAWTEVQKKFDGIEIIPYLWDSRLDHIWYYGWDVASGCIWNPNVKMSKLKENHRLIQPYIKNKISLKLDSLVKN